MTPIRVVGQAGKVIGLETVVTQSVYDEKGRVIKLADANFVKNFDKDVKEKIYRILYQEFNGRNPNSKK